MRVMTASAAAMLMALAAGAATAAPKTLKFNLTTVTEAQGMHMNVEAKVWVKGGKARAETNDPRTGPMLMLVDGPKTRYLFPQQRQGILKTAPAGKHGPGSPGGADRQCEPAHPWREEAGRGDAGRLPLRYLRIG